MVGSGEGADEVGFLMVVGKKLEGTAYLVVKCGELGQQVEVKGVTREDVHGYGCLIGLLRFAK